MTRENKLALVIGFALIVFVGVLVSDYFSAANLDKSANLVQNNGRSARPTFLDGDLIDLDQQNIAAKKSTAVAKPAVNTAEYKEQNKASNRLLKQSPENKPTPYSIRLPDLQAISSAIPTAPNLDTPRRKISTNIRTVIVKANESLSRICQREYREGSLAIALAEYNGITDPNMIRAGTIIRIPHRSLLGISDPPHANPTQNKFSRYTVKTGETLSEISLKLLKTSRRWRELYELNRDVINDPNNVRAGISLKIPTT